MSYDFQLLPIEDGADSADIEKLLMADEEESLGGPTSELRDRVVAALQARNPNLTPFEFDFNQIAELMKLSPEDARARFQHVELSDNETGIQITLYARSATVTVPYWHSGERADCVFQEIWDHLNTLRREAGYVAYDRQLSRLVETDAGRVAALQIYLPIVAKLPSMAAAAAKRKSWWKFW